MNELLTELDMAINQMLDNCNPQDTPTICRMTSTKKGRKIIFNVIRNLVVTSGMSIGECINQIEMTYDINLID